MNLTQKLLAVALTAVLASACSKQDATPDLTTDAEKFGYAIGVDIGKSLAPVKDDVDLAALKAGMADVMKAQKRLDEAQAAVAANPNDEGAKAKLAEAQKMPDIRINDEAREKVKAEVSRRLQEKQMEERTAKAAAAKETGEKFLAENGKREGVKTTASGLQYEMLAEGSGAMPKASDKVTVHYKGTLIDGTEFDSSYARGQPVTFPLGNVIPGWTEGLQLVKAGGKAKLYIPSNLAYGERGAGAKIGPNEALIFEVELVSIEKGDAKK